MSEHKRKRINLRRFNNSNKKTRSNTQVQPSDEELLKRLEPADNVIGPSNYYKGILKTSWGFKNYGDYYQEKVDYYLFALTLNDWVRIFETMREIDADYDLADPSTLPKETRFKNFIEDLGSIYFGLDHNSWKSPN